MKKVLNHFGVFQSAWKVVSLWICALFLLLSFVDWEQRRLYCNKEAAATSTCCAVSFQLSQLWFVSYIAESCAQPRNVAPNSRNKFKSVSRLRGRTLHLIALFLNSHSAQTTSPKLRETSSQCCRAGEQQFPKHFVSNDDGLSFFFPPHRAQKLPLFANFWEAVALSGASQHHQGTQKEESAAIQTLSHLLWSSLISNSECFMMGFFWTLPRCVPEHPLKFSPQSAPHQTKEKRTAPLALSPRWHSFPMSLSPCSLLLCAQVWALTHQNCGSNFRRDRNVEKEKKPQVRGREDHSPEGVGLRSRRRASRKKSLRGRIQLFLLLSPPLSTRVIDGWGSFWPRLVHFALQRVPPSPSQTMRTRIRVITNEHSCKYSYLFFLFISLFRRTNFFGKLSWLIDPLSCVMIASPPFPTYLLFNLLCSPTKSVVQGLFAFS